MIRFLTAGESHGKALTCIIEGFPAGLDISEEYINNELRRRKFGYGRGPRQKMEADKVEILSGIRFGKTIGSPITLQIKNKDWENWTEKMSPYPIDKEIEKIEIARPGHADYVGTLKYNFDDIRNSIERSSARETTARVAACSIAKRFLEHFGITIGSFVESMNGVYPEDNFYLKLLKNEIPENFQANSLNEIADNLDLRVLDEQHNEKLKEIVKQAAHQGETVGGTFITVATGVPLGLGSFMHYDRKLNAKISFYISSINAVKAVEIGAGIKASENLGSKVTDDMQYVNGKVKYLSNFAGGIEGGISNGMPIIVRAAMKPIPTVKVSKKTINIFQKENSDTRYERSDVTAVPACAVISESMLAWAICEAFLEKFSGDSIKEIEKNYRS
ncbi:MAG TPA: chorismate synthase [Ignavibacteriales bacterium]|nr:chorismate synthase [Ignavibacteriales bacterium]HOL81153.1 chorismate synthase [Ignavibacteriales bacterium]HPD66548.1 chorismate synthase [Ignavibacteriales bacterium]HPP33491.1 chorismate synthase [Ignavibacteriales bacterium]HRR18405.1 chorismate synthase [Ignavibacteriales bacterium]